jgi:hypothetical protein
MSFKCTLIVEDKHDEQTRLNRGANIVDAIGTFRDAFVEVPVLLPGEPLPL